MVTYESVKGRVDGVSNTNLNFERETPIECPSCHKGINILFITHSTKGTVAQVFLGCPLCKSTSIGEYHGKGDGIYYFSNFYEYKKPKPKKEFSQEVIEISENFTSIYSESEIAEENSLKQICGVGYRKAIEFLIKDYLTSQLDQSDENYEINKENINNKSLMDCISQDIQDIRIKEMAKRAVWLGNDETHYIRKWEEKDLSDLKKLIEIIIHFIEVDVLSKKYLEEM